MRRQVHRRIALYPVRKRLAKAIRDQRAPTFTHHQHAGERRRANASLTHSRAVPVPSLSQEAACGAVCS